jgi:chromate transport protein ChrA
MSTSFGLENNPALLRLGELVHTLQVGGAPVPEANLFEAVVAGARERAADDEQLSDEMGRVLDSLHTHFASAAQSRETGGTIVSTTKTTTTTPGYTLWQLVLYMLRLGTFGFGCPVALVGYMHRYLVEQREWIGESDYREGIALAQMMPGPLAAQLGIHMGHVHYPLVGATLAGIAFVLPSFLMVVGLGWAYAHFGGLPWMQAALYGVGAAVVGIIAMSAYKLATRTLGRSWLLWAIYLTLATGDGHHRIRNRVALHCRRPRQLVRGRSASMVGEGRAERRRRNTFARCQPCTWRA